ncbi:bifunctional phosphoribosylaminoimidazolecarboxamide formyltransferase/IMP cyclohydrolase [Alloscardovia omnicolens]|uniref:bifunctional phosphoribosylaminoimidazolecarboxamide formyltransferase/IMP cyclohydrolase n=1 Tax=Alloscardovia omnicolens TaxID=419015 RepID=UPI000763F5D7|nr:bifunctional phosphoribosylaminoimidazolecarboxamide formyltransferase/IMP cyclohydrolase [Alloscardovia omnicolens]KWZ73485.1 phosphoribosylaminoimidazolecarboxamide formyltransferase/IMP cyclohydrolase [Alloscardovia omnicolens]MDK6248924.1 bifunctional phosphoribosylaminoimidazolecarboxamide formyltransferase/IMP cyclohydrolase [Alloscardovia omnicolens]MDK6643404.1 bifunctional phosphoribosylaminoimidazolecarboxamide formyltransferase/IMP cyclohydrolase [Alloscardovia omnicolens]
MSETTSRPIKRALVSVYHKEGLEVLAQAFVKAGTAVVSTGSTAQALASYGVDVTSAEQVTGFPECLDGRVKTLHPRIHAGILADMTNADHVAQLKNLEVEPFDAVIVNLYPFADTVRSGAGEAGIIEKIDIGGPSMVRASAKNAATVAVITDPADYALLAERVDNGEGFTLEERRYLAAKAFAHTAAYDSTIIEWASKQWTKPESMGEKSDFATYSRTWDKAAVLRYGENSHQNASLYVDPLTSGDFAHAEQLGGKPMSYNNYVDADSAWRSVWDFPEQIAVAVVKHSNPCGLAIGDTVAQAHKKAHACDPMSAYGGVIAANTTVSLEMAQNVKPIFTEVIVAPDYEPEALELLQTKKNLRILKVPVSPVSHPQIRQIDGGLLVQDMDIFQSEGDNPTNWTLVAGEAADEQTLADLQFAWRAVRSVKSNAILIAHDGATVGIGMGQVNRVDSSHLAVDRANTLADGANRTQGAVAASDAFFPFADGMKILTDAGVKAIVHPGGSIRDEEVFQAAQEAGITMYVTGTRHFFH